MRVIVLCFLVFHGTVLAQNDDSPTVGGALGGLLEKDSITEDDLRDTVIYIYLECAALFDFLSTAVQDSRPNNAELARGNYRFYLTVGMALWANANGMDKVGDAEVYVKAYMENYTLDELIPTISESNSFLQQQFSLCLNDTLREEANKVITDLENQ